MIIRESISQFVKGGDPKKALGIGDLHRIHEWLSEMEIKPHQYEIDENLMINSTSDILLVRKGLKEFPPYIQWGTSFKSFTISHNRLKTLRGCPERVVGNFMCSNNLLHNLIGGPRIVEGDCFVNLNYIESLEGFPEKIGGMLVLGEDDRGWNPIRFKFADRDETISAIREICDIGWFISL